MCHELYIGAPIGSAELVDPSIRTNSKGVERNFRRCTGHWSNIRYPKVGIKSLALSNEAIRIPN